MVSINIASTTLSRVAAENTGASRVLAAVSRFTAITSPTSGLALVAAHEPPSCQPSRCRARVKAVVEAAVMGAGAWGTALAKVLADAGNDVTLWARRPELADEINDTHRNPPYLDDAELPGDDPGHRRPGRGARRRVHGAARACRRRRCAPTSTQWEHLIGDDATLVSLAKGIELDTLMRMSQVIVQVTGADPARVAVVTGPNLASEIADEQPAATVVACTDSGRAVALQRALSTGYFRPYTNADVIGAEVGGACKNVIALACGMAAGVGLGENTAAAIITRGLAEIMRLGIALGAKARNAGRPGRRRRPGGDVHVPALAQPHVRRAAAARAAPWSRRCAPPAGTSPRV